MKENRKRLVILGSTGSIGRSALEVIRGLGEGYEVVGLAAGSQWEELARQAEEFQPRQVSVADELAAARLRERLTSSPIEILSGEEGPKALVRAEEVDLVLCAMVGACGLPVALEAARSGKQIALANKEALVIAGGLLIELAHANGATILPVDSEHSAIFQALRGGSRPEVRKVVMTASGGPFYDFTAEQLSDVTPQQALEHPTWSMGRKVTIDSATLMNKGLEAIEAKWLFGLEVPQIQVVIHRQSIVHSMVEFCDGSTIAQLGQPDMRVPIQFALTYPDRAPSPVPAADLCEIGTLTFEEPDAERFPALALGFRAAEAGGTMGAVLNAANEVAAESFLSGRIRFIDIAPSVARVMDRHRVAHAPAIEDLMEADRWARQEMHSCLQTS